MPPGGLYEKVLGRQPPALYRARVRASAAVVPWRRQGGRLEVFWVRRSEELAFMGGFYAFPGGGRARGDAELELAGAPAGAPGAGEPDGLPAEVLTGVPKLEPALAPGVVAAALRELFEETGILPTAAGEPERAPLAAARRRLLAREGTLAELAAELGVAASAAELVYAGRWLTPPLGPVRFDNRFFLLEWPAERRHQPEVWPGELVAGEWIEPAQALARWWRTGLVTAPPILHILACLAEEGMPRALGRLRDPSEANLGPFRRIEFRPGVVMFPLRTPTLPPATHTNAYVVGTRDCVLVDPGSPYADQVEGLLAALADLERAGRRVSAIWLTHHHPDHVGGVEAVRRALAIPVCAHRLAAERLAAAGIAVDRELADGERLELAGEPPFPVRVVHTPGHTRGHLAFFDERHGSLLAGDLVAGVGTLVIDPPEGDMDAYLASLRRARELGARVLFPAHGPLTLAVEKKIDEYLEHRAWREERILEAWASGRRGAELLRAAYDDVPEIALPLAERQLEAHLARLERGGRLGGREPA